MRATLSDVWGPAAAELVGRLSETADPPERRRLLEAAVLARRAATAEPDRLVLAASKALGLPGSRVRAVAERLALRERQLLRRFKAAVGYGPKTLDRVLRFQRFLVRIDAVAHGDGGLARLASELGSADQAHLSRDCVALSGLTPAALARTRIPFSTGRCEPDAPNADREM